MSKIIRSTNAQQPEDSSIVEIKLQNFFEPIHYGKTEDEQLEELSQQKSIDIEAERQQLLEQANYEIEQQKAQFEQYRTEQLAAIEALKQSWEEEKLILQQEAYDAGFAQGYEDGVQRQMQICSSLYKRQTRRWQMHKKCSILYRVPGGSPFGSCINSCRTYHPHNTGS